MPDAVQHLRSTENSAFEILRSIWGRPFFEAPGVMLFSGDCLALMRDAPPSLLDLTVTSPPYNIGKEYESVRPMDEFISWCSQWMTEIHRLTKDDGAFWLNVGYVPIEGRGTAVPLAYLLWNQSPFHLLQEVVWNYGAGVACRLMFSPRNEKFLWFLKDKESYAFNLDAVRDPNVKYPNQKKNGKLKCNPLGKNPTDVWTIPKVTSGANRSSKERAPHPAQFPMAVIERILRACSNEGDLVFDPFLGSGTTAEVAVRNRRSVVGIEINPKYLEYAANRIESVLNSGTQTTLFK